MSGLAIDPSNEKARVESNREFHGIMIDAARNQKAKGAILRSGAVLLQRLRGTDDLAQEFRLSNQDHGIIVAALQARDADRAE